MHNSPAIFMEIITISWADSDECAAEAAPVAFKALERLEPADHAAPERFAGVALPHMDASQDRSALGGLSTLKG